MLDAAALSHVFLWVIGAMSLCAAVVTTGALIALGRPRKD